MHNPLPETYQKQKLLFFLAADVGDEDRKLVREMIDKMSSSRTWVISPPKFVDTVENSGDRPDDFPIETVGGEHEIYSALGQKLPHEIDVLHLEEVEFIVEAVQRLSLEHGLEFEFELDGQYVGTIDNGIVDATLAKGLIDEWRVHVNTTS